MTRMFGTVAVLATLGCLAGCQRPAEVSVAKLTDSSYRLTLKTYDAFNPSQGQRELTRKARSLCGDAPVVLGHFVFEGTGDAASRRPPEKPAVFVQDISCGAPAAHG